MTPWIDRNKCNNCEECLEFACPCASFKMKQGQIIVKIKKNGCIGCEFCVENCPSHAISLNKKKTKRK